MGKTKNVSIGDIAVTCGVGISSVSRAMNGKPGVRPEVRAKILKFIDEMGWRSNSIPFRIGKSSGRRLIVFLVPAFHDANQIVSEVAARASLAGFDMLAIPGNRSEALKKVLDLRPWTVVESSPFPLLEKEREKLVSAGIRYISVSNGFVRPGVSIHPDWIAVGRKLAKVLRLAGHRKIGCFTGLGERTKIKSFDEAVTAPQKLFFDGISSAHREFNAETDIVGDNYSDLRALSAELKRKRHTAWICDDWKPCMLFLRVAWELKLRIPEDVSLITLSPENPYYLFPFPVTRYFMDVRANASKIMELLETTDFPPMDKEIFLEYKLTKGMSIASLKEKTIQ